MIETSILSEAERASVILMLLDDDEAANILGRLDPGELELVGRTMCQMEDVGPEWVASAIAGFIEHAGIEILPAQGRYTRLRTVMTQAVGEVKAQSLLERIAPAAPAHTIELARWLAPPVLIGLIRDEHPQAVAVLLLLLEPEQAAQVLAGLPEAAQPTIVERIARLGPVSAHAVNMLNEILAERIGQQFGHRALKMGGAREAADLINHAAGVEQIVMPEITRINAPLAQAIEAEMFKFDMILALEPLPMGRLLRDIEGEVLIDALKGLEEDRRGPIFAAMSERAAEGVRDEIESRGRIKRKDVEAAQQRMIDEARKLAEQGEIAFGAGGDEGDYV